MIPQIKEINFPEYATLSTATATLADMGDMTINAQVKIDGNIVPNFSYDWEVEFKGERYIQPLREPQASKGNDSISSIIDLTFYHWAIYEMKRNYFVEMTSTDSGTPIADKYNASLGLNIADFCIAFQKVLNYYYNGKIIIDLNPEYEYKQDKVFVSIAYSYIWEVLQSIHPNYGVRWYLQTIDNVCYIKVGYPTQEISHIFEYGFEGGLMKIERQVQNSEIRNRLLGRGGEQNLPAYYFKEASEGSLFASDPDAIPELANIYFSELRGKTFRDYVKGWKAKHYNGEPMSNPTEAYTRGYTDTKFSPIEYVDDKQSIDKYGVLIGALENLEDIYPSIQEVKIEPYGRIDEVVAAEEVTNDDIEQSVDNNVVVSNLEATSFTWYQKVSKDEVLSRQLLGAHFVVPEGRSAILTGILSVKDTYHKGEYGEGVASTDGKGVNVEITSQKVKILDINTGKAEEMTVIPAGQYYYLVDVEVKNISDYFLRSVTVSFSQVKLITTDIDDNSWKPTFDIWVKNLWDTTKSDTESDEEYTNRVWTPILGANGEDAVINFGSGWLAVSDYDFVIKSVAYDTSKSYNGVSSEWRLTLYKTDAELEATGKYLPNSTTNGNAKAGDYFYFTGIELPHQYVLWAEEKIDERKRAELTTNANVNPTWVVNFDKVRLNTLSNNETQTLFEQIVVGAILRTADSRFIADKDYLSLYITSITYQFGNGLLPEIEVVLSDKQLTTQSPLSKIQGEIDGVYKQLGVLATAETAEVAVSDIMRKVGGKIFLRKDGQADKSLSPTIFSNLVSNENFRQGLIGGAGWGIYEDEYGNTIIEADKINARQEFNVNNFVVNNATVIGGEQIISSAYIECSKVLETSQGYQCFFDQHDGSVGNLFEINDIAYAQVYDTSGVSAKYYKRLVIEVGENYITLSKLDKDGDDIPEAGDVIIHFGNTTNVDRQGIIVLSPYGEGAPYIRQFANVNGYSLEGKLVTQLGKNSNIFTGQTTILPNSTGAANLTDLEIGGSNMIRNSGFIGDYVSKELDDDVVLEAATQLYSDPLDHWEVYGSVVVQDSEESQSKKEVVLTKGSLTQQLENQVVTNEKYVLSFKAKGGILNFRVGGVFKTIILTEQYEKYIEHIVPTEENNTLFISGGCALCDLKLERGTIATSWSASTLDNNKELTEIQGVDYLKKAITEGSTEIVGGLVLTNIVKVGEHENEQLKRETGGMSGYWSNDNDIAFWAGGDMRKAIKTAQMYKDDASYQPTQAEIAEMAKFVVTHGGRAILNDIILRGYVYADGGVFKGDVYAERGLFSGFIKRTPTIITDENYTDYMASYESEDGNTFYDLDLEKSGSFIVFNGDNWSVEPHFYLPSVIPLAKGRYTIFPPSITIDGIYGCVGQTCIIMNNSNQSVYVCSNGCYRIDSGETAKCECIMDIDSDTQSWRVFWQVEIYQSIPI